MSDMPWEVTPTQVLKLLGQLEPPVLIDCREASEYQLASIPQAELMPMSQWADQLQKLEGYRDRHVVVHCHHGGRSLQVVRWLRDNGFPASQSMAGGIDGWSEEIDPSVPRY